MTAGRNPAASARARLLQRARSEGRPFDEILTYYGIERFLCRLAQTRHRELLVLKGALMLPLWAPRSRERPAISTCSAER